jgi:hypothetical protein
MAALNTASGSDQKYWVALTAPCNRPTEPPHAAQFSTNSEPARRLQSLSTTVICYCSSPVARPPAISPEACPMSSRQAWKSVSVVHRRCCYMHPAQVMRHRRSEPARANWRPLEDARRERRSDPDKRAQRRENALSDGAPLVFAQSRTHVWPSHPHVFHLPGFD